MKFKAGQVVRFVNSPGSPHCPDESGTLCVLVACRVCAGYGTLWLARTFSHPDKNLRLWEEEIEAVDEDV